MGCSTVQPRCTKAWIAGRPVGERLAGRAAVHEHEQRAGAAHRDDSPAARHSRPCTVALPDFHVTARGSTRPVASNPPTGPRAIARRPEPFGGEHDDLRRRHRAGADARDAAGVPSRGRGASPSTARAPTACPAPRSRAGRSRLSLRHHASSVPSGDHAYDRWPGPHVGLGVLALLGEHRTRVRAVGIGDPQRRPAVGVGDERELRPVGREARLARRDRVAADRHSAFGSLVLPSASHGRSRVTRPTACRAGPTRATRAASRRATTPGSTRSRRARRAPATPSRRAARTATSHASSRSIAHATSPRAETAGATARPSRVQHPPRRRASSADRDQAAVAGRRPRPRRRRPSTSRRRPRTSAVTTTGGVEPSAARHHEVGAAVEAVDPGQARRRPATTGDRPRRGAGDHRRGDPSRHPPNASSGEPTDARDPPGSWAVVCLAEGPPSILVTSCRSSGPPAAPRRSAPYRLPHLPRQPALRGPGRLQPPSHPGADRARALRDDARGPAVAGRRRPGDARAGRGPRPLQAREPVPRAVAVRVPHVRRRAGVRDHVHAPDSPSRTRSAAASTRRCATGATSSTSSTTTSASARGLLGFVRDDWPFVNTLHHPITVDRDLDLAARERTVAPHDAAPLVRLPRHADEGRAPGAAPHHGVGELEEGHRRADGRRPRHAAHRAGRRRPGAVPPAAARRSACRAA